MLVKVKATDGCPSHGTFRKPYIELKAPYQTGVSSRTGTKSVPTGISIEIPPGFIGRISASSKMTAAGIQVANRIIDSSDTGEIELQVSSTSTDPLLIKDGDPLARIHFVACEIPMVLEVGEDNE